MTLNAVCGESELLKLTAYFFSLMLLRETHPIVDIGLGALLIGRLLRSLSLCAFLWLKAPEEPQQYFTLSLLSRCSSCTSALCEQGITTAETHLYCRHGEKSHPDRAPPQLPVLLRPLWFRTFRPKFYMSAPSRPSTHMGLKNVCSIF